MLYNRDMPAFRLPNSEGQVVAVNRVERLLRKVANALDAAGIGHQRLLAIEVALITDVDDSPIVRSFSIESSCGGVFE